jgi:ribose/xylose/arabinose/galactoside ABC-type transport system permease subunit
MESQMTETETLTPPVSKRTRAEKLSLIRQIWPWLFLILMVIVFAIISKTKNNVNFISYRSVQGILVYATQILLIGLAETIIIISGNGGVDLSVHYTLGFAAVIAAYIMRAMYAAHLPPVLTIVTGFSGGILFTIIPGWVNGKLVANIKVPPFISTLGMGYVMYGSALLISRGQAISDQPNYLAQIGNGNLMYYWPQHGFSWFKIPAAATQADLQHIIPLVPNIVAITLVITIFIWFILSKTQFGQHIYAIGGNIQASIRSGIPVASTLTRAYTLAAILAGIAGVIWTSRFTSGASNAGEPTLLFAIAAVVIGGTSMFGGEGRVVGTVIGALIIATIQYGLVVLGQQPYWQYVTVGVVVIIAVIVDQLGRRMEHS